MAEIESKLTAMGPVTAPAPHAIARRHVCWVGDDLQISANVAGIAVVAEAATCAAPISAPSQGVETS